MLLRKFKLEEFQPSGDCSVRMLYPWEGVARTPFGAGWTHLAPGQTTKKHQHHELETYFVAYGEGEMAVDEETVEVGPGDVIFMPPFHHHVLRNTSESEDLLFLSIYWEDMSTLAVPEGGLADRARATESPADAATPTDDFDIGVDPLEADVHARYLRMRGAEVDPVREPSEALAAILAAGPEAPTGRELLRHVPADAVRFYLARHWTETGATRFSLAELADVVEGELEGWQSWLAELGGRLTEEYGGRVPATGLWTEEQRGFYRELQRLVAAAERAYASRSPQEASRLLGQLVSTVRRFADGERRWIGVPERRDERRTSVALELTAAKVLAILAAPLLPDFAARLWQRLGYGEALPAWEEIPTWVPAGRPLQSLEVGLFSGVRERLAAAGILPGEPGDR